MKQVLKRMGPVCRLTLVLVLVGTIGFTAAFVFLNQFGLGSFYQEYMRPAVLYGCGHEYANLANTHMIDNTNVPKYASAHVALTAYVTQDLVSFDCAGDSHRELPLHI